MVKAASKSRSHESKYHTIISRWMVLPVWWTVQFLPSDPYFQSMVLPCIRLSDWLEFIKLYWILHYYSCSKSLVEVAVLSYPYSTGWLALSLNSLTVTHKPWGLAWSSTNWKLGTIVNQTWLSTKPTLLHLHLLTIPEQTQNIAHLIA